MKILLLLLVACSALGCSESASDRTMKKREMSKLMRAVKIDSQADRHGDPPGVITPSELEEIVRLRRDALEIAETIDFDMLNDIDTGLGDLVRGKFVANLRRFVESFEAQDMDGVARAQRGLLEFNDALFVRRERER